MSDNTTPRPKAPVGWSKAGAARLGREWRPMTDASHVYQCHYCGQEDCDCGGLPSAFDDWK